MILYLVLAIITGFCMAFQSPTNATLSRYIGNLQATCVSFGGGSICLALLMIFIGTGDLLKIGEASWWQFLGGIYGVSIVLVITFAMPRLGAALTTTILMLGQISMGAVIDTFGLMEMEALPLAPGRVVGCLLVLIGIILVYKGKKKLEADKKYNKQTFIVAFFTFLAGIAGAVQSPTNTALASHVGRLEASFMSFITGFAFILIITLITTKCQSHDSKKEDVEWWMLLGGLYGAAVVFINIVTIPHLGSAVLLIATMLGQLTGGTLVDSFGLLKTSKIKMNKHRVAGILIIAIGVIIVALTKV